MTIKVDIKHVDVKSDGDPILFVKVTGCRIRKLHEGMGESVYVTDQQEIHIFKDRRKESRRRHE